MKKCVYVYLFIDLNGFIIIFIGNRSFMEKYPARPESYHMNRMTAEQKNTESELILRFHSDGSIWRKKLIKYIPPMLVTRLSTLLLVSVDSIVVGNLVGDDALSSVSLFYPISLLIGVISVLIASGSSTAISNSIGSNDQEKIERMKRTTIVTMVFSAIFLAIIQIPLVYGIIIFDMDLNILFCIIFL